MKKFNDICEDVLNEKKGTLWALKEGDALGYWVNYYGFVRADSYEEAEKLFSKYDEYGQPGIYIWDIPDEKVVKKYLEKKLNEYNKMKKEADEGIGEFSNLLRQMK